MLISIQDGEYEINSLFVAEINRENPSSVEVTMPSGNVYTLEGKDITALDEALESDSFQALFRQADAIMAQPHYQ